MSLNVKNKLKVLFIIVLVILVSCGKKQVKNVIKETEITEFVKQNNIDKEFNIGIFEYFDDYMDHYVYNGFVDYLKEKNVKFNLIYDYCARGNFEVLENYVDSSVTNENIDLFYCIGNEACELIRSRFINTSTIAAGLVNPEDYIVISDRNKTKFAAIRSMPSMERLIKLYDKYVPTARKIGIVYSKDYDGVGVSIHTDTEAEYQYEKAKEELEKNKYEVIEYTINKNTNFNELAEKIKNEVDAIYVPIDRIVLANCKELFKKLREEKVFSIGGNGFMVGELGVSVSLAIDYYEVGKKAGEMAYEYLVEGYPIEKLLVRDADLYSTNILEYENMDEFDSKYK